MTINYNFFKKHNMRNFLSNQFLPAVILIITGVFLVRKYISPLYSSIAIIGLYFYSYFIHIFFHLIPENISPHYIHHNNDKISRGLNLMIETLTDTVFFVMLYFFQKIIKIEIFPNILILYYGIIYVSVHIINFSIFGNKNHKKHHKKNHELRYCNYGPDSIDHLLGSNCDNNWENQLHFLPNIVISYLICNHIIHL